MRSLRQQLLFQLQNQFDGMPWYGLSTEESLENISAEAAVRRHGDRSVIRLIRHMLAWRTYVLRKLQGDADYEVDIDSDADWPDDDAVSWEAVLQALRENQAALLVALEQFPEEKLLEQVPGRDYRFAFMVEGLVQHEVYHLGQVNLLGKG